MLRAILLLIFFALITPSYAELAIKKAQPIDKKNKDEFVVISLITKDSEWLNEWNSKAPPKFQGAYKLKTGEKAHLITLFAGASLKDGEVLLYCDITTIDPDGTKKKYPAKLCYKNPQSSTRPSGLHLTSFSVSFERSATDLSGLHQFEVGVTDMHKNLRVLVKTSIEYEVEQ